MNDELNAANERSEFIVHSSDPRLPASRNGFVCPLWHV